MATESLSRLKGNNKTAWLPPPKRGNKILFGILEDLIRKRVDARIGKAETTTVGGVLEDSMLKPKGKDESSVAQKRKNSGFPPRRGMIKVRIFDELTGPAPEDKLC